jgi:hypothetical protein
MSIAMARLFCLSLLALILQSGGETRAAKLPALDKAWTDHCVGLYKDRRVFGGGLRNYCVCLQEIVGHADRFGSAAEMEGTYPRQTRSCRRKTGLRMR